MVIVLLEYIDLFRHNRPGPIGIRKKMINDSNGDISISRTGENGGRRYNYQCS